MGIEAAGTFKLGDRTVFRLGYGAMRLCGPGVWGFLPDRGRAREVLQRAVALGVNLFDTSDAYGPEVNEYQIQEALHPYRGVVIATKGGLVRGGPGEWTPDGRPEHLRRAITNSCRRLGVEAIELYQLHAPDDRVPYADSVGALARAKEEGLIRHVGLSNVSVAQLDQARAIVPIATVQNRYNLAYRVHQPVLDQCTRHGIGFIPWYPLAAGPLAEAGSAAAQIAARYDATPSQVALAWLLAKSPVMLPIPGTSSIMHLQENCAAAMLELSAADMAALDAVA
jgi:pyridoxine 4-dehydrogenase